jgi:hypothetical protein
MKAFIQGTVLGTALTAAAVGGYAYGTGQSNQTEIRPGKVKVESEALGSCNVRVGYGHITAGDTCYSNEVMTGSRSGYILCSDVEVTCDRCETRSV